MAKKKVTRRAAAKKTVKRSARSSSSSPAFFKKHKHLRWLLPLLLVAFCLALLVHHYVDGALESTSEHMIKDDVRSSLHLPKDNDSRPTYRSTYMMDATPTSSPTDTSNY